MSSSAWNPAETLGDPVVDLPGVDLSGLDLSTIELKAMSPESTEPGAMDFEPSPYEPPLDGVAEICLYRKRTIKVLRRYARLYVETSRLPSALCGMEFHGRISSYPLQTFEDAVIFVWDVERCLGELSELEYEVVARVILRNTEPDRVAQEMRCSRRSVFYTLPETLDKLSKKFLRKGILCRSKINPKSCQGANSGVFDPSS